MNERTSISKRQEQAVATTSKPKALALMAGRLNLEPEKMLATLKATVCKNCSDEETAVFVVVANEFGLNPFLGEVHAFPKKGGGIVPVIGVDGWNKMMLRQEQFDGIDFAFENDDDGNVVSCTASVFIKNRTRPIVVTEFFEECARDTDPWRKMPRRMLRHKALNQASRLAFGFSGVYDEDEAIDIVGTVVSADAPATPKPRALAAPNAANETPAGEQPKAAAKGAKRDVHTEMQALLDQSGASFNVFRVAATDNGWLAQSDSFGELQDVPAAELERLLRNPAGVKSALETVKESMQR